jgi:ankyrin repeat protein
MFQLIFSGNPNKQDLLKGFTAIHYAAKNGHEECLKRLLENGARFDVLSHNGESCFDVAKKECLKILQQYSKFKLHSVAWKVFLCIEIFLLFSLAWMSR